MDLFNPQKTEPGLVPLSERMRPRTWADFIGQEHIVREGSMLRMAIEKGHVPSMIFWGPPGSGKTSLAHLISKETAAVFVPVSAVSAGVKIIKQVAEEARQRLLYNKAKTIMFVDEVHRFSKSQQDAFLPFVENGTLVFIGATTENPSFEVNPALLSRSQVFVLHSLDEENIETVILQALKDKERGLGKYKVTLSAKARKKLANLAHGDCRVALNLLENLVLSKQQANEKFTISEDDVNAAIENSPLYYDKAGDSHYNTISAFIKSMRAGAVDAAVYYLARMVESGEDPKFIARRMVVFASEDVGMAQPTALVVANEVFKACETIGYPECAINLAHGVVYLATAKKDRRAYDALRAAQADVKTHGNLPIPKNLLNAPTKLMENLDYGKDYEMYPEDKAQYLPEKLKRQVYFKQKH